MRAGLIVIASASMLLAGCQSTVSGTAVRAQGSAPRDVSRLDESDLDHVLLSIGELNDIVGSTRMEVTSELDEMSDHSADVSDPDCLGAIYAVEEPVYAGSGWTAFRDQVVREPDDDNDHWVEQAAVLYPSAAKAQKMFGDSAQIWEDCENQSIEVRDGSFIWDIGQAFVDDDLVTQISIQDDSGGWECQHAMGVVSNVIVETWACGYGIGDEAATIAGEMVANAATR